MLECVLCLTKIRENKSIKIEESIEDNLTLEDAIKQQFQWANITSIKSHSSCTNCYKSMKNFYEFVQKINLKHPPDIKPEKSESSTAVTFVNLNESHEEERPVEIQQLKVIATNVKVETDRFDDDSDFEWSLDENDGGFYGGESDYEIEKLDEAVITKSTNPLNVSETLDESTGKIQTRKAKNDADLKRKSKNDENTKQPPKKTLKIEPDDDDDDEDYQPIKPAKSSSSGFVRYIKRSQITQEMIDKKLTHVVIKGVEYKIPRLTLKKDQIKVKKENPNKRAHPSHDPEGEERIRRFVEVKCHICQEKFESFFKVNKHFKKFHPETKAYLMCCGKKFTRRFVLLDHIEFHDKSAIHKCEQCNKIYRNKFCLKNHMRMIHSDCKTQQICNICGNIFANINILKKHMDMHIIDDRTFECYVCKKTYRNEALLKTHMKARHNYNKPDNMTVCHICSATFRESYFPIHMKKLHGDEDRERVKCDICGYWLLKSTMKTHIKKHTDTGVTCPECGKFLKSKYSLSGHMKRHTNEPKFKCEYCDKGFFKHKKMQEHVAVKHTREFLFKCRVEGCGREFRAEGNWRIHEKKFHPEEYERMFKPFYLRDPNDENYQNDEGSSHAFETKTTFY